MEPKYDDTIEIRLRRRIGQLEKTIHAYDHAVNTSVIDGYRRNVAQLESALIDVVFLSDGGAPVDELVRRGLSAARAHEIVSLLRQKFS